MLEQNSPSASEYRKVLTKILTSSQKNSYLWDPTSIPKVIQLFSGWTNEQDNERVYYGITKNKRGKLVFYSENSRVTGQSQISTQNLVEALQRYHVPIGKLKASFLEEIGKSLRLYEILNAGIDEKVTRRIRKLEEEFTH